MNDIIISRKVLAGAGAVVVILGVLLFFAGWQVGSMVSRPVAPAGQAKPAAQPQPEQAAQKPAPESEAPAAGEASGRVPEEELQAAQTRAEPSEQKPSAETREEPPITAAELGQTRPEAKPEPKPETAAPEKPAQAEPGDQGPVAVSEGGGPYVIQVGAFKVKDNADGLAGKLKKRGYTPVVTQTATSAGDPLYLVTIGGYHSLEAAEADATKFSAREGMPAYARKKSAVSPTSQKQGKTRVTYSVQAGTYDARQKAEDHAATLAMREYNVSVLKLVDSDGKPVYAVQVGEFDNLKDAQKSAQMFEKLEQAKATIRTMEISETDTAREKEKIEIINVTPGQPLP